MSRTPEEAAASIPDELLLSADQDVLAQWCLARLGWPAASEARVAIGPMHHHMNLPDTITIHVPLLSDADEFAHVGGGLANGFGLNSCGPTRVADMQLTLHGEPSEDPARFRSAMTDALRHAIETAESCARTAREIIAARRRVALENLRQQVARRVAIEEAVVAAKLNLGIPLTADPNASPVPIRPVGLNLERAIRRAENEGWALALDADVREQILSTIGAFGRALERLPITAKRLAELDEEALRDVLLFVINANWQSATGEAFSGEGKTDIQLQFDGRVAFMAELKLYSGPKAVRQAIDQVSGYMVWRDTHAALVMFIKDRKNVSDAITQIRGAIKSHDRFVAQVPGVEDSYTFATSDDLRTIVLDLIAVPL